MKNIQTGSKIIVIGPYFLKTISSKMDFCKTIRCFTQTTTSLKKNPDISCYENFQTIGLFNVCLYKMIHRRLEIVTILYTKVFIYLPLIRLSFLDKYPCVVIISSYEYLVYNSEN